jgi:UDPglucose--hexose-1-phosphate uridylyltransferase
MPELRKDPIMGRWVIISTERARRPSDYPTLRDVHRSGPCAFCYGHEHETPPEILAYRPNHTAPNTPGWSVRIVPNKFPALRIEGDLGRRGEGLYDMMNGIGAHEVIIESPDHDAHIASFDAATMTEVIWAYHDRIIDLKQDHRFRYILIFKNHGSEAGASLEHTHSQLIALPVVPLNVVEELHGAHEYFVYKERCVFCDLVRQELDEGKRIVEQNEHFVAVAPFAPRFPFETWILPKAHAAAFENGTKQQYEALARLLLATLRRLHHALDDPPFNYTIHTASLGGSEGEYYHWHFEILPKLTRVAGFEWGTGFFINPMPPEEAARFLREVAV